MAGQIKVNESAFDTAITSMTEVTAALEQQLGVLRQNQETMWNAWDGSSAENYLRTVVTVEQEFADMISEIRNLTGELADAKTNVVQTDLDLSKKMNLDGKG